ncbi:glycosyltransferase [Paenalcaligenes sp. Me52]|uniref:glycosyltransferase n=1 Tax=Paenalcaligenes sp. Me52 TaxID=3392038 RepID=UPI003D273EF7
MKNIIIFYPSHNIGGAEYLLKLTADLLKLQHRVRIVDIKDGWLSKNTEGVPILFAEEKIALEKETIVITTANLVRNLDLYFTGDFTVLAWVVHPYNVIPFFPALKSLQFKKTIKTILKKTVLRNEYKRSEKRVKYLIAKKSIFAMDSSCDDVLFRYTGTHYDEFLPVIISDEKIDYSNIEFYQKENKIKAVWLGRLDGEFKNNILIKVMKDLNEYAKTKDHKKIELNIVGNGPGMPEIQQVAENLAFLEVHFHLEKRGNELKSIITQSNIGFAMGTSAIEISAFGVPTILLDFSYSSVPDSYRYRWFFESTGYSLGRSIELESDASMGNTMSMDDVLNGLETSSKKLSEKCFQYAINNHSPAIFNKKINHILNTSSSSFLEMKKLGLLKKPFWFFLKKFAKKIKL